MRECMNDLKDLINSKVKCVWINTYEEEAALKDIKNVSLSLKEPMSIYDFSFVSGIRKLSLIKNGAVDTDEAWNISLLLKRLNDITSNAILSEEQEEELQEKKDEGGIIIEGNNNIIVLKDLHLMINSPDIIRGIRDIVEKKYVNYNTIIILSPVTNIPLEHEKIFSIINYDTPNVNEIKELIIAANNVAKAKEALIAISDDEIDRVANACKGLTYNEVSHILKLSMVRHNKIDIDEVGNFKIELVKKSNILEYKLPNVSLDDIGGNKAFKNWSNEIIKSMSPEAIEFGCEKPKGYLALGVPGSAKTILAEAFASKLLVPFLKLDMSKILDSKVGNSEKNMTQAINMIKSTAPCVLLIDEIEKTLSDNGGSSDGGTMQRAIGSILEFLATDHGVFVVMTSNDVSRMPPELTRSGRLDATWYFGLPDEEERMEIFDIHFKKSNRIVSKNILSIAADNSNGFTGAEIKESVKIAIRKSFNRFLEDGNKDITAEDIQKACLEIIPISKSSKEKIAALEDYAKDRARFSNRIINELGCNVAANKELTGILTLNDLGGN